MFVLMRRQQPAAAAAQPNSCTARHGRTSQPTVIYRRAGGQLGKSRVGREWDGEGCDRSAVSDRPGPAAETPSVRPSVRNQLLGYYRELIKSPSQYV